jgi:excisionase family DNA binding protein
MQPSQPKPKSTVTTILKSGSAPWRPLMDVYGVAAVCGCSTRYVHRMSAQGLMPSPVRLGGLMRWHRAALEQWIESGCPRVGTADHSGPAQRDVGRRPRGE